MNPFDLLKNMGNLQQTMQEMQEKLKDIQATGSAGGDMVEVTLNGQLEVLSVHISKDAIDPNDGKMLEDLVTAAFNAAHTNVKEKLQTELGGMAGGLPPGMMG